ncbi:MAG TPA: class I SAM-dependent methyltransferase [Candidatus Bipolaricaulis anaerobius]|nr:class I SAM-dependent methyltransferase [Candidatus Bipolaricaulis anaerobius]
MTIEDWIRGHVPVEASTSAALRYERMIRQAAEPLPGVHRPADPAQPFDWVEQAQIGAFLAALGEARRVLDIGTGDGWPALPLARRVPEVVALDPSPRRVAHAQDNAVRLGLKNVEVACAPAEELPFPDGSFDGAVAACAIEQSTDPAQALREAFRVLRSGGRFAAMFEDLSAELRSPIEETAELYSDGEQAVYRLVHRSLAPLREVEYELRFRASPGLRSAAEEVRPMPTFRATPAEPGLRPVAPDDPVLGIPLLEASCGELIAARSFELRHRSPAETIALIAEAGFEGTRAYGNITWLARDFFGPAHRDGLLAELAPHMDGITRAFGHLYAAVPVGKTSVFFLVARKP